MAKSSMEIVKEQLGELTFQLCCMDSERAKLLEENLGLKAQVEELKHQLEIVCATPSRPDSGQMPAEKEKRNGN